jgi:hypothetical protein
VRTALRRHHEQTRGPEGELIGGTDASRFVPRSWTIPGGTGDRAAWFVLLTLGVAFGIASARSGIRPIDADVYWQASLDHLYDAQAWMPGHELAYLYPPPLAQLTTVLHHVGWPLFIASWTFLLFAATAYAGRVWALALVAIGIALFPFVGFDHALRHPLLYPLLGNIQPLLVAAIVASFRYPALWSVVVLTKLAPGVGALWFAFRGEWRNFAIAVGATVGIAFLSFAIAPNLWFQFVEFAVRSTSARPPGDIVSVSFPVRLAMSVTLLLWGARTNRRWTVPVAAGWAVIALFEWAFVEFWMAAPVLWAMDRRERPLTTNATANESAKAGRASS